MDKPNGNAVAWFVDRHTEAGHGGALAFVDPSRRLTYGGLRVATSRFATALRGLGVGPERRVALVMLDTVDFPIAFWGAMRAGAIPVPVNTLLTPEQTGYVLADSRAEALVVSAPLLDVLRPVLRDMAHLRHVIVAPRTSDVALRGPAGRKSKATYTTYSMLRASGRVSL